MNFDNAVIGIELTLILFLLFSNNVYNSTNSEIAKLITRSL